MDYQELCKAINFETPKALFMQEKEIQTIGYTLCQIYVKSFLLWNFFVCEISYLEAIFEFEKNYGTSFLLFHAAIRAKNVKLANIAKRSFSPLFYVNIHPNYSVMDIHTDYVEQLISVNAPELKNYLVHIAVFLHS